VTTDVISPAQLAHFVLRTPQFEKSIEWWKTVLGAETRYENDFICFLTYDDEHHRLAILSMPHLDTEGRTSAGMEHVAFTYSDLDALLETYVRLKDLGIEPVAPVNHGMTFSLYYADPDGNQVELQVDSMAPAEAEAFMASDVFAANPIGVAFDPADIVARRAAGESIESLVSYVPA
jgi:catechol-2,3-dioxygenase